MEIQLLVQSFRLALDIGDQRPAMHCLVIAGASVSNSRKEFIFAVFESDSICAPFVQDLQFNFFQIQGWRRLFNIPMVGDVTEVG